MASLPPYTSLSPYSIYSSLELSVLNKIADARGTFMRLARNAERAERYNDVLACLKHIVSIVTDHLTAEERDFLCATFGRLISASRQACLSLQSTLPNAKEDDAVLQTNHAELLLGYKKQLEAEALEICQDALSTFTTLLERAKQGSGQEAVEAVVVYLQSLGDYHRYQAEILGDVAAGIQAAKHYKEALKLAESEDAKLASTHPILLTVVLNYSVCLNDIIKDSKQACLLSKEAFDQAISQLDDTEDAVYKDTRLILQLIRDNLVLWADPRAAAGGGP